MRIGTRRRRVDLSGIKEIHSGLIGLIEEAMCCELVHLSSERHRSNRETRNLQFAASQMSQLHRNTSPPVCSLAEF
jgi:hypothetical protein